MAARALRALRHEIMTTNDWSLRALYKTLETVGANRLRDAAVRAAYGMSASDDLLAFLLKLNLTCAAQETVGGPITPPGQPLDLTEPASEAFHAGKSSSSPAEPRPTPQRACSGPHFPVSESQPSAGIPSASRRLATALTVQPRRPANFLSGIFPSSASAAGVQWWPWDWIPK